MNYGYMPMGPPPSLYGNPYYGMPFSPLVEPIAQNNDGFRSSASQDEHQQLLEKVAGVLPDINRLLSRYKETHGQLSAKDMLAKQADLSHSEQLNKVRVELDATRKEYERVIQDLVGERGNLGRELTGVQDRVANLEKVEAECKALRTELEALQVNKKELTEGLDSVRRSKEEMQAAKLANETEIGFLKKALQSEKDLHHRNVVAVKEAKDQIDLKHKEFQKMIGDYKINYSKVQTELTSLLSKHHILKKDLDAARCSEADHKTKMEAKRKEFEDEAVTHGQEVESIKKIHGEDRERLAQEGEERLAKLREEHSNKEKEWQQGLQDIATELESEKAENQRIRDEFEILKNSREAEKVQKSAELVESLALWRTKSDELQKENQNLDRMLQGLGCATELKSKGDEFL
jgi:serine/arginine repetitive matrix protein 2